MTKDRLFFPPNLITIGTTGKAITNAINYTYDNGISYISTNGLRAITISNLATLSAPNIKCGGWTRSSTSSTFSINTIFDLTMTNMRGNMASGYYITEEEYTSTSTNANNSSPYGVTYAFYDLTGCTGANMSGYSPYNWALTSSVRSNFPATW
jgi:hypothetical protein